MGGACTQCPKDTYTVTGHTTCTMCPEGSTTNGVMGSDFIDDCGKSMDKNVQDWYSNEIKCGDKCHQKGYFN